MATVTSFTAERMLEIENQTIISATITGGHLILHQKGGTTLDLGAISGVAGPAGAGVKFLDLNESSAGLPDGTKICRRYA